MNSRFAFLSYAQTTFLSLGLIFVISRFIILGISCIGANHFQPELLNKRWDVFISDLWSHWDVGWYKQIVTDGYEKAAFSTITYKSWAFLPLYLLTIKAVIRLFPADNFLFVASLVSCFFTFSALLIISHVFKERIQNINRFLLFYLISAGSFYLSIPYSESLALFLLACTFYFTQKKSYFLAAFIAGLGAITRIQLLALLAIPLISILQEPEKRRSVLNSLVVLALFSIPTLIHMGYLNYLTGNPFAYFDMQETWGNKNPYPLESLVAFISKGLRNSLCEWLHFFIWSIFGACFIRNFKKIPLNEIVFCVVVFFISTGCERFYGASRYVLMLIPLYITLANEEKWFSSMYVYSSLIIGSVYVISFTNDNGLAI